MLLHGIAASAFILFGQGTCKDLKLILVFSCKFMTQITAHRVTSKCLAPVMTSSWTSVINSLSTSQALPLVYHFNMTPVELTKTLFFLFELTNQVLAQELQNTSPVDSNKGMYSRSCFSLPAPYLDLPMWSVKAWCELSPGSVINKLCFNFSYGFLLNHSSHLASCTHLININKVITICFMICNSPLFIHSFHFQGKAHHHSSSISILMLVFL